MVFEFISGSHSRSGRGCLPGWMQLRLFPDRVPDALCPDFRLEPPLSQWFERAERPKGLTAITSESRSPMVC